MSETRWDHLPSATSLLCTGAIRFRRAGDAEVKRWVFQRVHPIRGNLGTIGRYGYQIRSEPPRIDRMSVHQLVRRYRFMAGVEVWQGLEDEDRAIFKQIGKPLKLPGYHAFLSIWMRPSINIHFGAMATSFGPFTLAGEAEHIGVIDPEVTFLDATDADSGAASSSITIDKPAGVEVGQLLLAHIGWTGTNALSSPPSGWTTEVMENVGGGQGGTRPNAYVGWKIADAGDVDEGTTDYTWGFAGNVVAAGSVLLYKNTHDTTPIVDSSVDDGSGTPITGESVDVVERGMLLALFAQINTEAIAVPSGMTGRTLVTHSGSTGHTARTADEPTEEDGASGSRSAAAASSGRWTAVLLSLAPAD